MVATLVVGDFVMTSAWSERLLADGHDVETCRHALAFQDRFTGEPVDILIIDVTRADCGEGMLISQAQAIWPGCRIIAVAPDYSFRTSAIYRMGLWTPDELLLQPLNLRVLSAKVTLLSTSPRPRRTGRAARVLHREPAGSPVILEFSPPSLDIAAENR